MKFIFTITLTLLLVEISLATKIKTFEQFKVNFNLYIQTNSIF